jgi:hypothetical protein
MKPFGSWTLIVWAYIVKKFNGVFLGPGGFAFVQVQMALSFRFLKIGNFAAALLGANDAFYLVQRVTVAGGLVEDFFGRIAPTGQFRDSLDNRVVAVRVEKLVDILAVGLGLRYPLFRDAIPIRRFGFDRGAIVHAGFVEAGIVAHRIVEVLEVRADMVAQIVDHGASIVGEAPCAGFDVEPGQGQAVRH